MNIQYARKLAIRGIRKIGSYCIPSRYRLPFLYRLHLLDDCENELRYIDKIAPTGGVAIDVGANEGMWSFALPKMYSEVYAFEINGDLTKDLSTYDSGNIKVINKGLSSQQRDAILYIPVLNGFPLTGWASLTPGNCTDTQEHIEKPVEVCSLDTFNLRSVSFIKIDVEGHEVEVLKGSLRTIASSLPYVVIEVMDRNVDEVNSFFAELGYQKRTLYDLTGIHGLRENFVFVPSQSARLFARSSSCARP